MKKTTELKRKGRPGSAGLLGLSLFVCLVGAYVNLVLGVRVVYTHLFYLPIMVTGVFHPRWSLRAGFFFGMLHVLLGVLDSGAVTADMGVRFAIMVLFAGVLQTLGGKIAEQNRQVDAEKETLRNLVQSIGDGVLAVDLDKRVTEMNEVAEALTGWTAVEALGRPLKEVFPLSHECASFKVANPVDEVLRTDRVCFMSNHAVLTDRSGTRRNVEDSASPIKSAGGVTTGVVLVFRDVTERKAQRERIRYLSYHDELTGLYNRRFLEERLRDPGRAVRLPAAIVMGDLNNLKMINDAFGHLAGDGALKAAAGILSAHSGEGSAAVRWGGDEFVLFLEGTGRKEVQSLVRRMETACALAEIPGGRLSVAFGWALKEKAGQDVWQVFKKAEDHMYRKKLNDYSSVRGETLQMAMEALYEKNPRERSHSERVSALSVRIGRAMGLEDSQLDDLKTAGLLHDIGKIMMPDEVLEKPGKLTPEDWKEMRRHPLVGYRIIGSVHEMSDLALAVLAHHERWDGGGYPKGLQGEEIPLMARIIAVADAFDAMTSDRPYRKALGEEAAVMEVAGNAGTQFDPAIARSFVESVLGRVFEGRREA